ncbi:RNA-directed DNA polymerase from mobile element jockey [Eumeta japonica]|uniref:RNA-directed DNA polymerase from mobile element jockey n=1 Tax=Eumeta variegata TaxID=151549 RepID=A0A4C1WZD4_EUMVA|nr:RNA-directed DNA polymerase from mobile element jockey [Eumeta japonica]
MYNVYRVPVQILSKKLIKNCLSRARRGGNVTQKWPNDVGGTMTQLPLEGLGEGGGVFNIPRLVSELEEGLKSSSRNRGKLMLFRAIFKFGAQNSALFKLTGGNTHIYVGTLADNVLKQYSICSEIIEEKVLQKTSLEPKDDLTPVSLSEVQTLVKSISTRKASGLDGLQTDSLLSGLAKLFERVLKTRLSNHLFGKGLIIDEQFGFRPAHSCSQQVLRLVEYVSKGFKTKQKTVAVCFDVAMAFDRVWHAGLVYKLYSLQVPDRLILIIQNFLSNRHFTFKHERTHSTRLLIRAGVPQGSALSPLLYSAYTNDIPHPMFGVQLALFADDTALFLRSRTRRSIFRHLPRAIDELGQWFRKWRIEVNPNKSAAIQFKYSKNRSKLVVDWKTPNLKILNARIPWQRSYKDLGVTLDENLHFREHITRVRKNALFYTARLGAMHGRKGKLSRRNKRTLNKMCIRTVMTYTCPVFAHAAPKALYRLQRFFDIAGSHPNTLLRAAVDYQPPPPTHFIRRPLNVLIDPPDALTAAVDSLNEVNDTHMTDF